MTHKHLAAHVGTEVFRYKGKDFLNHLAAIVVAFAVLFSVLVAVPCFLGVDIGGRVIAIATQRRCIAFGLRKRNKDEFFQPFSIVTDAAVDASKNWKYVVSVMTNSAGYDFFPVAHESGRLTNTSQSRRRIFEGMLCTSVPSST